MLAIGVHALGAGGGVLRGIEEERVLGPPRELDLVAGVEDPGPAGFTGSLIIAEFDSLSDAQAWADADPYLAAGVYERVEVRPFKKVLP